MKKMFFELMLIVIMAAGAAAFTLKPEILPTAQEETKNAVPLPLHDVLMGTEYDQCSSQIQVQDKNGVWIPVDRGKIARINPKINADGSWNWMCGKDKQEHRPGDCIRNNFTYLKIMHSTDSRQIKWQCYNGG